MTTANGIDTGRHVRLGLMVSHEVRLTLAHKMISCVRCASMSLLLALRSKFNHGVYHHAPAQRTRSHLIASLNTRSLRVFSYGVPCD